MRHPDWCYGWDEWHSDFYPDRCDCYVGSNDTPLPPFESEGFVKLDQEFPRFACAGESVKIPGVLQIVSPRTLTRHEQEQDIMSDLAQAIEDDHRQTYQA